jgi:hypothetical protein
MRNFFISKVRQRRQYPMNCDIQWLDDQANILLAKAEALYSPRDKNYRWNGVRIHPNGPNIRFDRKFEAVTIELSPSTMQFPDQAKHQIAHEVIHLLAPDRNPPAIMLEEGLAVHFSIYGPDFQCPEYRSSAHNYFRTDMKAKNFREALNLFEELVEFVPEAIKRIFSVERNLFALTPSRVMSILPELELPLAHRLCERRQMRI